MFFQYDDIINEVKVINSIFLPSQFITFFQANNNIFYKSHFATKEKHRTEYNYDAVKGTLKSITAPEGTYTYNFNTTFGHYDRIRTPATYETQKRKLSGGFLNYDVLLKGTATLGYYRAIPNNRLQVQQDTVQGSANEPLVYVSYIYASDGKLSKAGAQSITYDAISGRVSSTAIGSGTASVKDYYTYNTYGELATYVAKYNTTTLYSLNLTYDNLGRIIKKQEAIRGISQTYEYAYDLRGRLNEVKKNGAIISKYGYDGNGNRTSGTVSGQTIIATYDSQDRLATYNANSFQYNANGELLSKKNTTTNQITPYTFNSGGQLTSVKVGSNLLSYQIDGFGRRIQKSVSGTLQGSYIYMDDLRLAGTLGGDGKVLQRYIYATKPHVPDYFTSKGEAYRIITDNLGSVRLVIRVATGAVVQEMVHDEFGRLTKQTAAGYQPFGFGGGLFDHHTNLVQFGARWYDPEFGRWISKDPIGFDGGDTNLYAYVNGDPMSFIDPAGTDANKVQDGIHTYVEIGQAGQPLVRIDLSPAQSSTFKLITNQQVEGLVEINKIPGSSFTRNKSTIILTPQQDADIINKAKKIRQSFFQGKRKYQALPINGSNCESFANELLGEN